MAFSEVYVDPLNGDDATGTGTSGAPYKTLSALLQNLNHDSTNGQNINIRNTAKLTETGSINADFATYFSGNNPSTNAPACVRGVDASDNPLPLGSYTEIDYGNAASFYRNTGYDYVGFENLKIVRTVAGTNNTFQGDNSFWMINCHVESYHSGSYYIVDADSDCVMMFNYIKETSDATNGNDVVNFSAHAIFYWNVVVSERAGTNDSLMTLNGNGGFAQLNVLVADNTNRRGLSVSGGICFAYNNIIYSTGANIDEALYLNNITEGSFLYNYIEGWSGTGGAAVRYNGSQNSFVHARDNVLYNNTTNIAGSAVAPDLDYSIATYTEADTTATESAIAGGSAPTDWADGYERFVKPVGTKLWSTPNELELEVREYVGVAFQRPIDRGAGGAGSGIARF